MKDLVWDKGMIAEFSRLACLTDEEMIVLREWAHEKYIANTAYNNSMSDSKVSRLKRSLRNKYDRVQPMSSILPPRVTKK